MIRIPVADSMPRLSGSVYKTRPTGRVFASKGFTLVELIVTMIILGVIASVAGPKFFGKGSYDEIGFSNTLTSTLGFAQKLAMTSGCDTRVTLTSTTASVFQRATACDTGTLTRPVERMTGDAYVEAVPSGLTVETFDIYYDSRGRPRATDDSLYLNANDISIGSRTVRIEAETGYVYSL